MKKLKIILHILLFLNCMLSAQQEFQKWFVASGTGLDFSTNPPTAIAGFSLYTFEGVASICDTQGNLLFYCNGTTINDASHSTMANGTGLIGNVSTTQSALIVKQPGNNNLYYVFTLDEGTANNQGAFYSIVDMSLAAGMGSVTSKNNFLFAPNIEKQIAVRHCNGKDIWIVNHEANNNNFRAYLLTANGLNPTPVISSTGDIFYGIGSSSAGEMKASPDGTKIGLATLSPGPGSAVPPYGFHLYDFDASNGTVSNPITLLTADQAYGVEFSPDGTKFYGTRRDILPAGTSTLCQWDICQTNTNSIISSLYTTTASSRFSAIQRALDNKLYLVNVGTKFMSVVHNPNNAGGAMNFAANSYTFGAQFGGCTQGLPNYVTGYTKPQNPQISSSINCQQIMFQAPTYTYINGCTNLPYPVIGYLWDFGDANSGSANTSALANPNHNFSGLGSYTVSLIVYSNCENDTIKKVINITTPSPTVNVNGPLTICRGEKHIYTANGGISYIWNSSTSSPTLALSPNTTTVCNVSTTASNGCTSNKQFTVTVNQCLGWANEKEVENNIRIWPNPFTHSIKVQAAEPTHIALMDLQGIILMDIQIESGVTEVDASKLPIGFYIVRVSNNSNSRQLRLVKIE